VGEEGEPKKTVLELEALFAQIGVIPKERFVVQEDVQPGRTLLLRKGGGKIGEIYLE
jgi:hypothetical protein